MKRAIIILPARGQFAVAARIGNSFYLARNWTALRDQAREYVQTHFDPPYPVEVACPPEIAMQAHLEVPA